MEIKILHIIDHLDLGGAQRVVKGIIKSKSNVKKLLFSLRKVRNSNQSLDNIYSPKSKDPFGIKSFFNLKYLIAMEKISILHLHLPKSLLLGLLLKIIFFPKIKLIYHEHGPILFSGNLLSKERVGKKIIEFVLNFFRSEINAVIVISSYLRTQINSNTKYPTNETILIRNFVDPELFKDVKNISLKREPPKKENNDLFCFGYAGRIEKYKGIKDLVKAFTIFRKEIVNSKLYIAGVGKELSSLKILINQLNLDKNFEFYNYVDDMRLFYRRIDCLVVPSRREGMGLVHLEAQACGTPVICSNIPGLTETVKDSENCLLFNSRDYFDLYKKMKRIKNDGKLREKLRKGGLENAKQYRIQTYIEHLEVVYMNI